MPIPGSPAIPIIWPRPLSTCRRKLFKIGSSLSRSTKADARAGLTSPEIRLHYVAALSRQGQRDQARKLLHELLAESPDFPSQGESARLLGSLGELNAT